eukprot:CAMPEP_0174373318 /NCGR_PEP_ID=MMETSP0811_2-20130205/106632_1 /TAXON_ID=73025 ORGANISM="Eutreptiella gymnastica-like, Strain CCMP1594" /NCGR_SAMPLE_ID=MMETSP0811_2 /ASSEMBLY_ACC=CAM_ASM_000667 /LENGTH=143 /DNA_ID=CAMNT_0015521511 /DNA_START=40 /DNA_END=472 /DNA_ORIENTATION=-
MAIVSSDNGTCTCYAHALHAIQGQVGSGWTQAQMVDSTLALSSAKQIRKAFHRHLSAFLSVGQSKANPHASRHATQLLPSLHDQCPLSNCDTAQCVSAFVQDHKRGPATFGDSGQVGREITAGGTMSLVEATVLLSLTLCRWV